MRQYKQYFIFVKILHMKILKYLFLLILSFAFSFQVIAGDVSISEARTVAKNIYFERANINSSVQYQDIIFENEFAIQHNGENLFYVFNLKYSKGFVLVSAINEVFPVLGYSFEGSFNLQDKSPSFEAWIDSYKNQIIQAKENNISPNSKINSKWQYYSVANISPLSNPKSIAPMVTTRWSQGCYYNALCPVDSAGPCDHVVTGCVATCMAQLINYHDYPNNGSGSHSYNAGGNYGQLTANFGNTTYDWTKMADTLLASTDSIEVMEVARLISHCGIAVEMMYSAGGSGAYSIDAANALVHYFNFSPDLSFKQKINYADSIWDEMLITNLDSLWPLYYSGSGTGGHAFVCDGYQGDDFFHFNWGWGGSHDGYFYTSSLSPGGMNFSNYCAAIFGMKPATSISCSGIDTLTAPVGNISDGSIGNNYSSNSNCMWLIEPQFGVSITLDFYTFDLENNTDWLTIYDGSTALSPVLGTYTGSSLPPSVMSTGKTMLIEFTSNNSINQQGWSAHYKTNYCHGSSTLTAPTDSFHDGSGTYNYNNNVSCIWVIEPPNASKIVLNFSKFKTESGYDYVKVYDGNSTSSPVLGNFDGHNIPPTLTSTGGSMLVHFTSDGGVVDEGWTAHYSACFAKPQIDTSQSLTICSADSFALTVPGYFTSYQWQLFSTDIPNANDSIFYPTQSGIYAVIVGSQTCPNDTTEAVTINMLISPNISLGNDTLICANHSLTLVADSGFASYLWSTGDTTQSITIDTSGLVLSSFFLILEVTDFNGCSASDTIQITFDPCTGISDLNINPIIKISPNPSDGKFEIEIKNCNSKINFRVINLQGQEITNGNLSDSSKFNIDLSDESQGVYFLQFEGGNWSEVVKLVLK